MSALTANVAVAVGILVAAIGLLLAFIAFLAFRRLGHWRMVWLAVAFLGFTAQGVLLLLEAWQDRADAGWPVMGLVSLGILTALYVAVLKR